MRRTALWLFSFLVAGGLFAAGCSGSATKGQMMPALTGESASGQPVANHHRKVKPPTITMYIGFYMHRKHRPVVHIVVGTHNPRRGNHGHHHRRLDPRSVPITWPTFPPGSNCSNTTIFNTPCLSVSIVPGETIVQDYYCYDCSSTPPYTCCEWYEGNFGIEAIETCNTDPEALTCEWSPNDGSYDTPPIYISNSCAQPYPTCYAQLTVTAAEDIPAEVIGYDIYDEGNEPAGTVTTYGYNLVNVNPLEVEDMDIGGQVVSSPFPSPSPIMVGQQVQLQATSANGDPVTVNSWQFATTSDVVTDYTLKAPTTTPQPINTAAFVTIAPSASPSANPVTFYWITPGIKQITLNATVDGVPETASVYYNVESVSSYSASAKTIPSGTQVGLYGQTGATTVACPSPNSQFVEAIFLGNQCVPHGIDWTFSATVPNIGAGNIYITQLISLDTTYSGGKKTLYCSDAAVFCSGTAPQSTPYAIDGNFPYTGVASVANGGTIAVVPSMLNYDAPASLLGFNGPSGTCTSVTVGDKFTDYFMYEAATGAGLRPSIPVTLATLSWAWGGPATYSKNAWKGSKLISPPTSITAGVSSILPTWSLNDDTVLNNIPSDPCA